MISHDVVEPKHGRRAVRGAAGLLNLLYADASGAKHTIPLHDGDLIIGRAPGCNIHVSAPSLSRQHARLRVRGRECCLSDAGSTNGTLRNGVAIKGAVELVAGDSFQCGAIVFTLEQGAAVPAILSEDHHIFSESASIIRRVGDTGRGVVLPQIQPVRETHTPGAIDRSAAEPRPIERRQGCDRRQSQQALAEPDRRSGRERRQSRFLRLLSEISKTLVDLVPLPQILSRVVDLVFESVPAERTYLLLRESSDAAVSVRVLRARDGSTPEGTLSRTVVTKVMRERVALLADDARYDSRLDEADSIHARLDIRSFMCAPLWNRNEVIGVLYADNPRTKRFTPEDLDVFIALANYAAVAIEQARMRDQLQREMQKRERLQRYHSPSVVNRIIHSPEDADREFEAAERDVTVMFTDIVGFTSLTERMPPTDIARLLNQFFAHMLEAVFEFEGTLDKFIGDAILAVFGAPFAQPDHADRAVQAALAMRRALAELNAERAGEPPLQIRIALNSGLALTGDIGSPRRREFTVLGDAVNTCSRIESSVCKPDQIVASGETMRRLQIAVQSRPLGTVSLRGRQAETEVFLIE